MPCLVCLQRKNGSAEDVGQHDLTMLMVYPIQPFNGVVTVFNSMFLNVAVAVHIQGIVCVSLFLLIVIYPSTTLNVLQLM